AAARAVSIFLFKSFTPVGIRGSPGEGPSPRGQLSSADHINTYPPPCHGPEGQGKQTVKSVSEANAQRSDEGVGRPEQRRARSAHDYERAQDDRRNPQSFKPLHQAREGRHQEM